MPIVERDVHPPRRDRALVVLAVEGDDPQVIRRPFPPLHLHRRVESDPRLHGHPRRGSHRLPLEEPDLHP